MDRLLRKRDLSNATSMLGDFSWDPPLYGYLLFVLKLKCLELYMNKTKTNIKGKESPVTVKSSVSICKLIQWHMGQGI